MGLLQLLTTSQMATTCAWPRTMSKVADRGMQQLMQEKKNEINEMG